MNILKFIGNTLDTLDSVVDQIGDTLISGTEYLAHEAKLARADQLLEMTPEQKEAMEKLDEHRAAKKASR